MPSPSPTVGLGPASSSQHAASRVAPPRLASAAPRTSSANLRRPAPPRPASAAPPNRRSTAATGTANAHANAKKIQNKENSHSLHAGVGAGVKAALSSGAAVRRISRAASANAARHIDSSSSNAGPLSPHAGHDVAYLYQQLQDTLQQQSRVEEERQRQLQRYRRQLRAVCDDNATLRTIIQAGETRRREAAIAVGDGVLSTTAAVRAHSGGTRHGPSSVTAAELEVLEQRMHLARQRHNRLTHEVRVCAAALQKEEGVRAAIAEEADAPLDPALLLMGANRPVYLRMMRLEHLLNEVLQKQSTVGVVLKNYRYHLTTLRDEATQYDVQQKMLEDEFAARHRDHLQLLTLYDSARAAYTDTVDARLALEQSGAKMRRAKESALQQKRREVDKELAETQVQERHAVDLQQQLEEETQLLEAAENTKAQLEKQRLNSRTALTLLKAASVPREGATDDAAGANNNNNNTARNSTGAAAAAMEGQLQSENTDERISAYEVAFRDMMQVANADTLDHLVQIYQAEMEQQCKLQDDLDDLRDTRATLQQEAQMLRERVKQTKYCVGAGTRFAGRESDLSTQTDTKNGPAAWKLTTGASPLMEREMETFLREEKETLAAQISENEQNQTLLLEVAERMNRLSALVAEYRTDVRLPPIRLSPALSKRSSTLPLHSAVLAQKLLALASDAAPRSALAGTNNNNAAAAAPAAAASSSSTSSSTAAAAGAERKAGGIAVVSSTQIIVPANNRRVPLAHERGSGGGGGSNYLDGNGLRGDGGGGRHRGAYAADVAGMSSLAARALLNGGQPQAHLTALSGSPDGPLGFATGAVGQNFKMQRKRRSSAGAGAGFIERQYEEDDDDGAQLATVAALPPPGGRVLDFDIDLSDDDDDDGGSSADHPSSLGSAGRANAQENVVDGEGNSLLPRSGAGGEGLEGDPARRRRSSAKTSLLGRSSGGLGVSVGSSSGNARGATAAAAAEDDQEDPLRRDEVKRMSDMILERRRRDAEEEARHK